MLGEHHNLVTEFPEHEDKIHELKKTNHHFERLLKEHHELDKKIRQDEVGANTICDEELENLKKKRLHLRDELYAMLKTE